MSSPPRSAQVAHDIGRAKRRNRPSVLDLSSSDSPDETLSSLQELSHNATGLALNVPRVSDVPTESESDAPPRSTSATSSLDPYYFTAHTPSESPIPPLPQMPVVPKTPDMRQNRSDPVTPARDPAAIDRRGLVGVGELATPRWTRAPRSDDDDDQTLFIKPVPLEEEQDIEQDVPDSPWTIEAVDEDGDADEDYDHVPEVSLVTRTIRPRPSIAEESGGEEILYPRQRQPVENKTPSQQPPPSQITMRTTSPTDVSFDTPTANHLGTRAPDALEWDQVGSVTSMPTNSPSEDKEKASVRRHRSLGVGSPPSPKASKERRRDTTNFNFSSPKENSSNRHDRHSRHLSASSSSSGHGDSHSRRVHATDFSHLPPSPSSTSIQQFLRSPGSASGASATPSHGPKDHPHTSNVAQSLLRGTQEGWSGMDDEATAEALRKLDGLSGKSAHASARVSVGGSRANSLSRPGTPAKTGAQWEGVGSSDGKRVSKRASIHARLETGLDGRRDSGNGPASSSTKIVDRTTDSGNDLPTTIAVSDDTRSSPAQEKSSKKSSARLSYNAKRGSTSSTNYTSSSRDSGSVSTNTSLTSPSATSGRHSLGKSRRNSTEVSATAESAAEKERAVSAVQDVVENHVPPVPPLPKDLANYRSPQTSHSLAPQQGQVDDGEMAAQDDIDLDRTVSIDIPPARTPSKRMSPVVNGHDHSSGYLSTGSAPALLKTPSKKWSFTNAFKLSNSPSIASMKEKSPISSRTTTFGQSLRRSTSKDKSLASVASEAWSTIQPDAMNSETSLASISSVGSPSSNLLPHYVLAGRTPDGVGAPSRAETASSVNTSHTASLPSLPHAPLSPTSSIRRGSSKRLTPSSIPFFRRSSSQSMQFPSSGPPLPNSSSPTMSTGSYTSARLQSKANASPVKDNNLTSFSTPAAHRKSSVLSLGLPSLLKGSSSRKSFHADKSDTGKDSERELLKAKQKEEKKLERSRSKKEDKDRSESRISVLMGRKRGKTLSSAEPKKAKLVSLPPIQVSAIPPATANRVASLKSSTSSLTSLNSTPSRPSTTSRATSQTASSMQKHSDTSLRRYQLPTIAGSPSVATIGNSAQKEPKELPPPTLNNSLSGLSKETPTKIPRIASRSSTVTSPTLKSRRTSVQVGGTTPSAEPSPTLGPETMNEFGVLDGNASTSKLPTTSRHSLRTSPSTSAARAPRQLSTQPSVLGSIPRKANRESVSFVGLRKTSTGSVTSITTAAAAGQETSSTSHHRFSAALSPSRGLKLLSPKVSLSAARTSNSSTSHSHRQTMVSPSLSQQSLSTPSPPPGQADEEELAGDEEMMHYIKRQQAKKLAHGATQEELDELLRFPEPLPPVPPSSPSAILKSNQAQYLSAYERKEILDYSSVYYIGARSDKKPATPENSTNNYGYDDERGDYLVVNHDHLAYRYEVMDTLGKGSFGQVLNCRDHCTGESVAIKIIRNKKRFHHQALVEIKILDNLRKWDPEEKHYVIKMTEHFYFRNHLCIAMELLSINLYELIKANGFVGFTTALIRRFTSQMLMSLSLMRHHRIVHCDLKPENVLLRHPAKSGIKVIDFGSSCLEHEKIYTYIQSRFYRSPEVILGMNYHMAIDMWSLGCILAELYTGFPIFPGENEQEQLSCIMEVLGVPDKDFINRSSRKRLFFDSTGAPRPVVNSKGRRRRPGTKTLAQVLRCDDQLFVDFIAKCLIWDPERRMKPHAALRHEFITIGKRSKVTSPNPATAKALISSASNLSSSSRSKPTETPKKSQIGAPTPLTARSARTTTIGTVPSTPSGLSSMTLGSSSRSYRASQSQSFSVYHTSRTVNSLTASAKMS